MRSSLALGVCIGGATWIALVTSAGCSGGSLPLDDGDGGEGGSESGPGSDAAPSDAPSASDAAPTDGGGGLTCGQLGGDYANAKACATVADCTTIAKGCYCGAQPIIGIAKTEASAAAACEMKAGSQCALGCANFPGHTAEDGNNDADGGTIDVLCDNNRCHTVLR